MKFCQKPETMVSFHNTPQLREVMQRCLADSTSQLTGQRQDSRHQLHFPMKSSVCPATQTSYSNFLPLLREVKTHFVTSLKTKKFTSYQSSVLRTNAAHTLEEVKKIKLENKPL